MPVIFARTKPPQYVQIGAVASNGALSHGDLGTILGPGLGTHSLNFSMTGGSGGMIESTAAGVEVADSFSGYSMGGGTAGSSRGKKFGYDDATRGRVFSSDYSVTYPDAGCFTRDSGGTFAPGTTVYISMWRYITGANAFGSGQIKLTRIGIIDDITDPNTIVYTSLANHNSGLAVVPAPNVGGTALASGTGTALFVQDTWLRTEETIVFPSSQGASDGQYLFRIHNGSNVPANLSFIHSGGFTETNINMLPDANRGRFFLPQHYFGNGNTAGTIRQDDHYFQVDTDKRIELCNNANYSLSTVREIQKIESWIDGVATYRVNKGGLQAGPYTAHAVSGTSSLRSAAVTLL